MKDWTDQDIEEFARYCERAEHGVRTCEPAQLRGEDAIRLAEELRAVALHMSGVACLGCGGIGEKAYGDTTRWRGGMGGQTITEGVCDKCWGTGRTDKTGPDQRRIEGEMATLRREAKGEW